MIYHWYTYAKCILFTLALIFALVITTEFLPLLYFNFVFLIFHTCKQHKLRSFTEICVKSHLHECGQLTSAYTLKTKRLLRRFQYIMIHTLKTLLYQQTLTLNSCSGREGPCEPPRCSVMEFAQAVSCVVNHSYWDFQSIKATFFPEDRFMKASSHKNKVK